MKAAVVGLGVEGKSALKSLLNRDIEVYASDLDKNIIITPHKNIEVDLGFHDFDKIESADVVLISPSLWNFEQFQSTKSHGKLLSDVFNRHKSILTIGVTGTNGKTTTCLMIQDIFQKAGYNVLTGGNAGGGFEGYSEIILEAENKKFNVLVVEVCDMTLDFCRDSFEFDLVVVTNHGRDHLDVHGSQEDYLNSLKKLITGTKAVLNGNYPLLAELGDNAHEVHYFHDTKRDLKVFGKFNQENAAAAAKVGEIVGILPDVIDEALNSFEGAQGRIEVLEISGSKLIIGKTDNADAIQAVMDEIKFEVVIVGTPRRNEHWRFEMLKEVEKKDPQIIALFPGLDNTISEARDALKNYPGEIIELSNINEVIKFARESLKKYSKVFLGGNGQLKIIKIRNELIKTA
ncbi:MAG TPA: Mur ligase family protein [Methanobacteriaceae archaeon]|nr:Mur ligase family protein [Methanobacteriaceae archaeon]